MMKRTRPRIFYAIFTLIFAALALINLFDILYFHPPVSDENRWIHDPQKGQIIIQWVVKGGISEKVGIREGDVLLAIDGNQFTAPEEAQNYLNQFKPGDQVTYTIKRGNRTLEKEITLVRANRSLPIVATIVGMLFLLVGFVVVYKKPYLRVPRLFYYFCVTFFIIIALNNITSTPPLFNILFVLFVLGVILWAPSILHFFMNYPKRVPLLHNRPKIIYLFYIPSVITAGYVLFIDPAMDILINIVIVIYVGVSFHILSKSKKKITNPHEKKSLRVIKWGMMVGLIPLGVVAMLTDQIVRLFGLMPVVLVFSLLALVPIAFGYSIMRYGMMDVEIIIKKSLVYSILTSIIVLLYFGVVVGLGGMLATKFKIAGRATHIVFLAIVALAFQPIRNGIQQMIDRRFYRERYQYQKTLLDLSRHLPSLVSANDILKRVTETIANAMHVSQVIVHLYDNDSKQYLPWSEFGQQDRPMWSWKEEPNGLISIIKKEKQACLFYKIEEDAQYHNLPISDKVKIEKYGIVLTVPMFYQNSLLGMISQGMKQSEQVYNQEDLDLLQTVANNTAIALMNARLHQGELRKKNYENELLLARKIQLRLLPKKDPQYTGMEIVGVSKPATIVGGDYYDYMPITDNRLFIFVGDVSGKGMPAALYMSKVQGMIHMAAGVYKSVQRLLIDVNRNLYSGMERNAFVTMLGAMVDIQQKKVVICRAGHMPVLIKRNQKIDTISGNGIGLGLEAGDIFQQELQEKQFRLKPGEYCLFYTDGLLEAMNDQNEIYGEERLRQFLTDNQSTTAHELRDSLLKEIDSFRADQPQNDDITFVIVKAE